MIVVQDTREKLQLDWSGIEGIEKVEVMTLSYGDYTAIVHGKPVPILFCRKSFSDLWGTFSTTDGHRRFKNEMERAKSHNMKLILIIEGSYSQVLNGFERSQYSGKSMMKKLATLYTKYDLEYIFCESRKVMAMRIADTFSSIERGYSVETDFDFGENKSAC
jgi:ERCC4-type nuclease